jgi:general secretion pathway protein G
MPAETRADRWFGRTFWPRRAGGARGFSLLELVIVIVIVALLSSLLLARLLALQADAERVAMQTVLRTLNSALGMTVAEALVQQDFARIRALEGSNPMDRLAKLPENYLGAMDDPNAAALPDAHWYFDTDAHALVYLVRHEERFRGGSAAPARAIFAVRLVYADRNGNGSFDDGVDSIEGIRLAAVEPYEWTR